MTDVFLALNGYELPEDEAENIATWQALAANTFGEADLAGWLRARVVPPD